MKIKIPLLILVACPVFAVPSKDVAYANLVKFEGYRNVPYRDSGGWAVGVGHNITYNKTPLKPFYSDSEIKRLFERDYLKALAACKKLIVGFESLPVGVQLVCINIAFSCGETGLEKFRKFRLALSRKNWHTASIELKNSKWFSQVQASRRNWAFNEIRNAGK